MFKVVEIFVGGILTGLIPSGVALGIKWFKDKRAEKNGCRYILRVDAHIAGVRRGAKTDDVASVMFSLTKGETNKLFKRISKFMEK